MKRCKIFSRIDQDLFHELVFALTPWIQKKQDTSMRKSIATWDEGSTDTNIWLLDIYTCVWPIVSEWPQISSVALFLKIVKPCVINIMKNLSTVQVPRCVEGSSKRLLRNIEPTQ